MAFWCHWPKGLGKMVMPPHRGPASPSSPCPLSLPPPVSPVSHSPCLLLLSHPSSSCLFPYLSPFLFSSSFYFSSFYSLPFEPIFSPFHRLIYVKLAADAASPGASTPLALHPPPSTSCLMLPHMLLCSCNTEDPCTWKALPSLFHPANSSPSILHAGGNITSRSPFLRLLLHLWDAGTPLSSCFSHCIEYVYSRGPSCPSQVPTHFYIPASSTAEHRIHAQ